MNDQVCTKFDGYMRDLCFNKINMSWSAIMQNGVTIYGDYERPGYEKCWDRFVKYCRNNNVLPTKIKLYMFGAPELVFFEDESGLDGISICRGAAKEQTMDGSVIRDFQFLSVSLLSPEADYIDVRKFVWPENNFEEFESTRLPTKNNIEYMVFRDGSEKLQKVQKHIYGTAL